MGDLTKNLSRHEFVCRCNKRACDAFTVVDYELVTVVQDCVDHFSDITKKPLKLFVLSGNRCSRWNAYIWGGIHQKAALERTDTVVIPFDSYHTRGGIALDFCIESVPSKDLFDYLTIKYPDRYGIGKYANRVHLDLRIHKARW